VVRVESSGHAIVGRAEAIEADGRLRVAAVDQVHRFSAADVVHVRDPMPGQKNVTGP
jgi:biotin-(acetyl-CoA carboxylase) ligase